LRRRRSARRSFWSAHQARFSAGLLFRALLVQHGDLRRQRAGGLILLFLRRFGGGGQLGVLFGQRIKRGFLLSLPRCLFSAAICADSARGLILLFLRRSAARRSSAFFFVSASIVDFCRFSLCSFCVFSAAICTDSVRVVSSSFSAPLRQRRPARRSFCSAHQARWSARFRSVHAVPSMRRSAPSASGWSHPVFLRRFGSGGQLGVLFAQRAHGGSFAALFLYTLFTLQRGDLRRQFARRFSELFLRRFGGSAQLRILFPQSVNRTLCFILMTFFLTTSCF
jgi:hypothetical protein